MRSLRTTTVAGTVTAGGTSQHIAPRNPKRDLLILQNPAGETGPLFYNFGSEAEVDACMSLAPDERIQFDEKCGVPGETINVTATDSGHAFVLMLGQRDNIE